MGFLEFVVIVFDYFRSVICATYTFTKLSKICQFMRVIFAYIFESSGDHDWQTTHFRCIFIFIFEQSFASFSFFL
jgi:hypothetical protein